ncbi:hypothetical protein NVP1187O_245 [Vibrio phage 1.187.O._10N.286.49.F1]|nr:hypothetical protein NVP1187O_245 [Vibrio phage 1.187.O._10N.286.49.F1]
MKHYDIEINKEMVLSTCHVQESTLNGCFAVDFLNAHNFSNDENNVRLHVEICLTHNRDCIEGGEVDFPEELINLLQIARSHRCKWLVLDCDGLEVAGLPTFDW